MAENSIVMVLPGRALNIISAHAASRPAASTGSIHSSQPSSRFSTVSTTVSTVSASTSASRAVWPMLPV